MTPGALRRALLAMTCLVASAACGRAVRSGSESAPVHAEAVGAEVRPTLTAAPDSLLRDLGDGRRGFCKANSFLASDWTVVDNVQLDDWCPLPESRRETTKYNTYVLENPHDKPVGTEMRMCVFWGIPKGWRVVERVNDTTRCAQDPSSPYLGRPNVLVIRRES